MKPTHVMFRINFNEVFALFPYEVDYDGNTLMYKNEDFIGCQYNYTIKNSKPANYKQAKEVSEQLINLGYNLEPINKRSTPMYIQACIEAKPHSNFN